MEEDDYSIPLPNETQTRYNSQQPESSQQPSPPLITNDNVTAPIGEEKKETVVNVEVDNAQWIINLFIVIQIIVFTLRMSGEIIIQCIHL